MISDETVLITGGTGSFGKVMVRHILSRGYKEIRVFSRDEEKQDAMRSAIDASNIRYYIGDIRDASSIRTAMVGVDRVFHAAALKQVPSCEFFPMEAVRTNVIGSSNVIDAAVSCGAKSIVCLSTDKAVNPVNAMGMSKAMMEKVALAKVRSGDTTNTTISCVRYGNVMYSRGSVIPRFIQQIKDGKPITITNPDMTRFLMPLSASVELVEFAFTNANQGDIFIKKAPATTIKTLAEALLSLFNASNELQIIGSRHGEKLHETLVSAEELTRSQDLGEFYRISLDDRDLNYGLYFNRGSVEQATFEDYDSHSTNQLNVEETKALLLTLSEVRDELEKAGLKA